MESLYRKYRPQTFDTMVGQKHIVMTLENALSEGRTAHAYLFSGPRGTGKTTTARLLAKALLCEQGPTPHPDGTCEQCEAIASGTHPDVYELDAASRTGVDNVREEIINRVAFAPTRGRYKVYIIDEVHMLTTAAFNALLKTLEEPPEHVVFVLCTTDPQKVPETILSRCQRLEFHRIVTSDIEERLAYVCEHEGFTYDEQALRLIAKHARGGLRDALSMLEQLSVFGDGAVRLEDAQNVLGEVPDDALAAMMRLVARRDVAGCFAQVADLADRGFDVPQYARDLTRYVRNVYVASVAGDKGFEDPTAAAGLTELAGELGGPDRIAYLLDLLGRLESDLRTSLDQRLSLEVTLTRMARPASDLTLESLAARVAELERTVADLRANGVPAATGAAAGHAGPAGRPADAPRAGFEAQQSAPQAGSPAAAGGRQPFAGTAPAPAGRPLQAQAANRPQAQPGPAAGAPAARPSAPATAAGPAPAPAAMPATSMDPGEVQRLWGRVVDTMMHTSASVGALLRNAEGILSDDGTLTVVNHGAAFAAQMLMRPSSSETLARVATQVYGRPVRIAIAGTGAPNAAPAAAPATQAPARPQAPASQRPAPASRQPVAPASAGSNAPARPAAGMPAAPAATAPDGAPGAGASRTPSGGLSAAAIAAAAAAAVSGGTAGRQPAVPAQQVGRAPGQGGQPARQAPAVPADDAPGYEFVPDEVYDAYGDAFDEEPMEPSPEGAAVAALSGASKQPIAAPGASAPAAQARQGAGAAPDATPPWEQPAAPSAPAANAGQAPRTFGGGSAGGAPAQPPAGTGAGRPPAAGGTGGAAAGGAPAQGGGFSVEELTHLLSEGFGGYVKVTEEP